MKRENGKKLYSIPEFYRIIYLALRSSVYTARGKKKGLLSKQLIERIMLAVTEVNRCPMCSYGHTKMALEAGMSIEEIHNLLRSSMDTVPDDEINAVLFAQHYADSRGKPDIEAWDRVVDIYGEEKAKGILGAARMIMFGNTFGIVLSSIRGRFKGDPDPRSSVIYETAMVLALIPLSVAAAVHALIAGLFRLPIIA